MGNDKALNEIWIYLEARGYNSRETLDQVKDSVYINTPLLYGRDSNSHSNFESNSQQIQANKNEG